MPVTTRNQERLINAAEVNAASDLLGGAPLEIRNMIWKEVVQYALVPPAKRFHRRHAPHKVWCCNKLPCMNCDLPPTKAPDDYCRHVFTRNTDKLAFLRVCHQMHQEILPIFFAAKDWSFKHVKCLEGFVKYAVSNGLAPNVKHIRLCVQQGLYELDEELALDGAWSKALVEVGEKKLLTGKLSNLSVLEFELNLNSHWKQYEFWRGLYPWFNGEKKRGVLQHLKNAANAKELWLVDFESVCRDCFLGPTSRQALEIKWEDVPFPDTPTPNVPGTVEELD
jgi:hypothetical protein